MITTSGITSEKLVSSFLAGRSAHTMRAYSRALGSFAAFMGRESVSDAARDFLSLHPGEANSKVLDFQHSMASKSPATRNLVLAAIRSMVKLAKTLGMVSWNIEIDNETVTPYRDTRGPGKDGVSKILNAIKGYSDPNKAARDAAIARLLFDRGLRRGEVAAMDLSDVDLPGRRISITGKGRSQKEWVTIAAPTIEAIARWIACRGNESGPLFHNLDKVMARGRLSTTGIYKLIGKSGRQAGIGHVRPHGLRHAAGTHALDVTNGDIRKVARFMRHKRPETTIIYDDNRKDFGGEVSEMIAS